ncbi:MAG: 30S ribosomal protein S12 methylthiotransferase RimO [Planctomycetes bacterium]|nr:30S ribosomal protein S12 methylthiotransferase RimO [Planctomycetota bacterium]
MKTVGFISLGCPKNLVDSEVMLGALEKADYKIVSDGQPADIFIINTCCFIKDATEESESIIRQALALKNEGKYKKVVVAGCLPQRVGDTLKDKYKADAWLGSFGRDEIVNLLRKLSVAEKPVNAVPHVPEAARIDNQRWRFTPKHFAYLRIAEGCDNRCTYCVIPRFHGRYRSKPMPEIIKEAEKLAKDGVKEINLIAQDTTYYGKDLYGKSKLAELLRKLAGVKGVEWIRVLYTNPRYFTDDLINEIAVNKKVVKYIDIPIQHISDNILRKMGRGIKGKDIIELITKLRKKIKGLFLRTSIIVGFPGETEKDFNELMDFLNKAKFERLGAFIYSPEEGTPAFGFEKQITEQLKAKRLDTLMRTQQKIAFGFNWKLKGKIIPAIIDSREGGYFIGRIYGDAPEVDGNIFIKPAKQGGKSLRTGAIYNILVTGSKGYDLTGALYESC